MTGQSTTKPDLRYVAGAFLLALFILIMRNAIGAHDDAFFNDTDDAMRMVVVHDFINGQGWYDLIQQRLNTPWGAEIHWSRLVDLPLAALTLLFRPFFGLAGADIAVGYVWPLALLAVLLWLSARLALRLVGPAGVFPALILPLLAPSIISEFVPGRVDHHNVIIVLTLAIAWVTIEAIQRPRYAIAAGLLSATAIAIATESIPTIAAAALVFGFIWVLDPTRGRTARLFGLTFAIGSIVHLALYRPPSRWFEAACDVLSPVYVGVALVVAAAFTIVTLLPAPRQAWQRLLWLGALALAGLAVVVALYPECLKGPYAALDPWLQANWIASINEAMPWTTVVLQQPAVLAVGLPTLIGLGVIVYRLVRVQEERAEWAALLVFLLLSALVMFAQVRGARLALMPAMPAAAWLIVVVRQRYLAKASVWSALALVGSWVIFAGTLLTLVIGYALPARTQEVAEARTSKSPCMMPSAFEDLAAIPAERMMTPIDLGAHMLLYTPHAVVAAPYHRNQQGVRDAFRFFNDPIAEARTILDERGIGLVVICPGMAEMQGLPDRAEDSFVNLYARDALPAWLEDVSLPDAALKVFAVLPQ
ncbi:hypothetical protein WH87_08885 [Devosia epidermidihirudinis]|uniref:Glycosyltransferase RgtA/B/C/D-like domain-containing protein n=1 Tax=Devosia epidermidihirudinis TaxID=1293439 RepID=A0A0F5QCS5_9HYPH|nr:hypothetical protein [Devosia epidermidihirudinis]KKC37799.1 hypothetical protein WH87_08885 [Devosia epidermidihirudinis]